MVALHPKNNKVPNLDTQISIFSNKTAELIRDSFLVITHDSSAMQFAILWNKPLLFITTDQLSKSKEHLNYIKRYADSVNKNIVNIDKYNIRKSNLDLSIDKHRYIKYLDDFVVINHSVKDFYWDIVIRTIEYKI